MLDTETIIFGDFTESDLDALRLGDLPKIELLAYATALKMRLRALYILHKRHAPLIGALREIIRTEVSDA